MLIRAKSSTVRTVAVVGCLLGIVPQVCAQTPTVVSCPPTAQTAKIYASQEINLGNGSNFTATNTDFEARIVYPAVTAGSWSRPLRWTPYQRNLDNPNPNNANADTTGMIGIHTHLLPDGTVLSWEGHNDNEHVPPTPPTPPDPNKVYAHPYIWYPNPNARMGSLAYPKLFLHRDNYSSNIFCAGHTFLADGRLLVAGGHFSNGNPPPPENSTVQPAYIGLKDANTFNHLGSTNRYLTTYVWSSGLPAMTQRRWDPTATTLSNGEALVVAGQQWGASTNCAGCPAVQAVLPELWKANNTWQTFNVATGNPSTASARRLPLYPWMFLAPDGRVFNAGPNVQTGFFNPTSATIGPTASGTWTDGPRHLLGQSVPSTLPVGTTTAPAMGSGKYDYNQRGAGTACMYQPGKILIAGGAGTNGVTKTTELLDLTVATPQWQAGAAMKLPRTHFNSTILPDGTVLVTGGSGTGTTSDSDAQLNAELWTPPDAGNSGGTWTLLAPMLVSRLYHSTAILLPDATVLSTGGGQGGGFTDHPDYEIFTPPYLCKGYTRPTISYAPQALAYGQTFTVTSSNAATVARATLVRLSSVTHSFNMNQRFLELTPTYYSSQPGQLSLVAPHQH